MNEVEDPPQVLGKPSTGEVMTAIAGEPSLGQPVFNWGVKDNYVEPKHLEMVVMNIFLTKHYEINEEKVIIIKEAR